MAGIKRALFDSNIVIDFLNGHEAARHLFAACEEPIISVMNWMEVLTGDLTPQQEARARLTMNGLEIIDITFHIMEEAIKQRKRYRLKSPDAIIWATALLEDCSFYTRNTKGFSFSHPLITIPYRL